MVFKVITVIILVVFYGSYFFKMFSQKKKGIQTNQIGKGKTGKYRTIESTMQMAAILVPLVEILSIGLNMTTLPSTARIAGIVVAAIGTGIFIASITAMQDNWRAGVPESDKTKLVTEGIYRISRNPSFLGFDLLYIGILLIYFNQSLLLASLFGILMFHLQIVKVEEAFLEETFGEEYLNYKKKVLRYLGKKA